MVTQHIPDEESTEDSPPPRAHLAHTNKNLDGLDSSDDECSSMGTPNPAVPEKNNSRGEKIPESDDEVPEVEDDLTKLNHLSKKWDAPIYVFFKPSATIEYVDRRKAHVLNVVQLIAAASPKKEREWVNYIGIQTGGKGKIMYSQRVHTRLEAWYT
ncbi:hypothetical protein EI94DRAFT_1703856 [Lactarius quietus]|nr:hypothetical protein EI94DRAFT_1703856 [Lactarius quietus]